MKKIIILLFFLSYFSIFYVLGQKKQFSLGYMLGQTKKHHFDEKLYVYRPYFSQNQNQQRIVGRDLQYFTRLTFHNISTTSGNFRVFWETNDRFNIILGAGYRQKKFVINRQTDFLLIDNSVGKEILMPIDSSYFFLNSERANNYISIESDDYLSNITTINASIQTGFSYNFFKNFFYKFIANNDMIIKNHIVLPIDKSSLFGTVSPTITRQFHNKNTFSLQISIGKNVGNCDLELGVAKTINNIFQPISDNFYFNGLKYRPFGYFLEINYNFY